MANKHSEKYTTIHNAYSRPGIDHWRPFKYGKRGAKGNESGKQDRCRRKAAWFVGADGRKYGSVDTASAVHARGMRAAGYKHAGNGLWLRGNDRAVVASG